MTSIRSDKVGVGMTKRLTERQKYLMHFIVQGDGVSMDELVRRLEVSRRTIQRDMNSLQSYLAGYQIGLDMDLARISLDGHPADVSRMLKETGKLPTTLALTPKDREFYVAMDLLMTQGPLKLSYFGKKLGVTSASVSHNLDEVANWLRFRGLHVIRRRGYGIEVRGNEELRRESLAELVYDQLPFGELMSMFRVEAKREASHPLFPWFQKWFGAARIDEVGRVLSEELASMNPPLDEAAFYGFMLHVVLTCIRIEHGAQLTPENITVSVSADTEASTQIIRRLLPNATETEGEIAYLAKHLRGAKVRMTDDNRILPLHITSMDLAYHLVTALSGLLNMKLEDDGDLLVGLAQHLEPAIYRMKTGLVIRNPLLSEIKQRYGRFFDAMRTASERVLEPYGLRVPDAEIGYLTMHLGAAHERRKAGSTWRAKIVCPNGISSAELLASRMKNEFPQVRIVSVEALHTLSDTDCDFIVSTVRLDTRIRPIVTVSPFLRDEDVAGIQSILDELAETFAPMTHRYGTDVVQPNDPLSIQLAHSLSDRVQVHEISAVDVADLIGQIARGVCDRGDATDEAGLAEAIQERERLGSIVLPGKRLSVLHARTSAVTRCHIAVYRLHSPIVMPGVAETTEWVDTVLVMFALVEESQVNIRLLGRLSSALVMNGCMADRLRMAPVDDVRKEIYQAMVQVQE